MKATVPASKTAMIECIRGWRTREVLAGLDARPELLGVRDERGRNWLHLCASIDASRQRGRLQKDAIPLARGLLARGIEIDEPAFTEGDWHATALWYAVARGRNHALARFLLRAGSTPEYCLWAAAFNQDLEMIRILIRGGASLEAVAEQETPLLGAVKSSKFSAAAALLDAGANPDYRDPRGMTALHYMLKKNSDIRHYAMFVKHGARGDIPDRSGKTAIEILRRKRDAGFRRIAGNLATS